MSNNTSSTHKKAEQQYEHEEEPGVDLLDLATILAAHLRLLILGPAAVGLLGFAMASMIKPTFNSTTRFLPPQQQQGAAVNMLQSLGALGGLASSAASLKNPTDQYLAFLKTTTVQDALVDRFQLMDRYETKLRVDARNRLQKNTRISSGKDGIVVVEFESTDAQISADLANAYVEELRKLLNRLAITEAQQRRVFFEQQLDSAKNGLVRAEQILAASGISVSALNATPSAALEGPARLRAQVTAQEVKLASLGSYLNENATEFKQAQAELKALRAQLSKAEKTQPIATTNSNDYIAKYREFKYQETLFDLYAKQFEIARIDESREGAIVQIVDKAIPAEKKSGPKRLMIAAVSTIIAFFMLLGWVALRIYFRTMASQDKIQKIKFAAAKSLWID